jgi:hypothetical protein
MTSNNAAAIRTAGQALPNGVLVELGRNGNTGELCLLVWNKLGPHMVSQFEYGGKTYVPPDVHPSVLQAWRLPTCVGPQVSTRQLFDEICNVLGQYSNLPEEALRKITYFVFGTWLVDRVPIAPLLWIVEPATASNRVLLRLLALLCRRSLLLRVENPADLRALPLELEPTLVLDVRENHERLEKFLYASNSKGIYVPRSGQARHLYCARAICSEEPLLDPSLASCALRISVGPTCRQRLDLTPEASQKIADEFQGKLLRYRLTRYHDVQRPDIDDGGLTASSQNLAKSIATCIVDDKELQGAVVPLLQQQDRETQVERSTGLEPLILEALLSCCHDSDRSAVRAAELAEIANSNLTQRGETLRLSPESIGWRLKSLKFRTEPIGSGGNGLWLLDGARAKIHRVAFDYGVLCQNKECTYRLQDNSDAQRKETENRT